MPDKLQNFGVITVDDYGKIEVHYVKARSKLNAFLVLAETLKREFDAICSFHAPIAKKLEYPGESMVSRETILEQADDCFSH